MSCLATDFTVHADSSYGNLATHNGITVELFLYEKNLHKMKEMGNFFWQLAEFIHTHF